MARSTSQSFQVWALGCVLHFCVEARPRFAAEDDASSRALILAFDAEVEAEAQHERAQISSALNFEFSLLARHPCARPTMCSLVSHTFFAGIDVRTCHARPAMPLGHGCRGTAPVQCSAAADPAWAQSQRPRIVLI